MALIWAIGIAKSTTITSFDLFKTHWRIHEFLSPRDSLPCTTRDSARLFSHSDALYHADLLFVENLLYTARPESRVRAYARDVHARER